MRPSELEPRRWRRVDEIFDAALTTPAAERDGVLDAACGDDPDLRREVDALLAMADGTPGRFDEPLEGLAARILATSDDGVGSQRVGPFRIEREIGRGGMGVVYLAADTRLGRPVALKVLSPHLRLDDGAKRRFEAEARTVSALDHPCIATLHDIDAVEDRLYMVFAYYEGETLEERISRGPLPLEEATRIAFAVAEGLGAAHAKQIVHRDVKPSNILLTESGGVKLLDFGVAKVVGEQLTGDGARLGTISYMSPEQVGAGPVDERADLWSLGVVLYEMLTGESPFRGDEPASTLRAILHDEPAPPASIRNDVSESLSRVVEKLLCKEPDGRYRSTSDLLEDLRAARAGSLPPVALREPPPARRTRIDRIAVLPLTNLTGDPGQQPIVSGVHDALIAQLGKIHALQVVSRTSTLRFQDVGRPLPEIAEALDVDAVVEGSVSRHGDELTITAQLIAPTPERHLWAETYRRDVTGVLDVAGEVARAIAAEIEVTLSPAEETRLATSRPVAPAAYEAFTLAQFHLDRRSRDGFELAQKYLRRSIEIDPGFAPAYALLAEAFGSATFFGQASPAEGLPIVRRFVRTALALDGSLAAAHTSLGAVKLMGDWDWDGAQATLRHAITLNPSYAYAHYMLAEALSVVGRHRDSLESAERARALERFVPSSAFGPVRILYYARDFDAAIDRAHAGLEFFSGFWLGRWLLALALTAKGLHDEAVRECEAAVEASGRLPMVVGSMGPMYVRIGRREAAEAVLAELADMVDVRYVGPSHFVMIHAALGDRDRAFEWLERACEERDMGLIHLIRSRPFDELRPDPRARGMLERMHLEGAWSAGAVP